MSKDVFAEWVAKNPFTCVQQPSSDDLLYNFCYGLELELEDVVVADDSYVPGSTLFYRETDGSLRGSNSYEYKFIGPLRGANAETAVKQILGDVLSCTKSNRCSLHVHLDVSDMSTSSITAAIMTYMIAEKLLYIYAGKERIGSNFCIPVFKQLKTFYRIAKLLKRNDKTLLTLFEEWGKYSGLNLQALRRFGSMEFRQHRATTDYQTIINWLNILGAIKQHGMNYPNAMGVLEQAVKEGPRSWLENVFGDTVLCKYAEEHSLFSAVSETLTELSVASVELDPDKEMRNFFNKMKAKEGSLAAAWHDKKGKPYVVRALRGIRTVSINDGRVVLQEVEQPDDDDEDEREHVFNLDEFGEM